MSKYLLKVSYSAEGLRGVMKEGGTNRVKAVEHALAGVGGSLESFYFAFGQDDVYVIADVPTTPQRWRWPRPSPARVRSSSYETVVLLSPSGVDPGLNVTVDYAPPGS